MREYFITTILFVISSFLLSAQFSNATIESNLKHLYTQPQFFGAGAVFFDLDNDGWEDLFCTGGMERDKLYLNKGDGRFEDISYIIPYFNNGISSSGVIAGDIDNDGCIDLFITTFDRSVPNILLRNDCQGNFIDISSAAKISEIGPSIGAAFIDIELDGDLDIYVANYIDTFRFIRDSITNGVIGYDHVCHGNYLYINNGDNTFTEAANSFQVGGDGCTLAVLPFYGQNGETIIYTANDFGEWIQPNEYFVKGVSVDSFVDLAPDLGLDAHVYGMGIALGDIGNDLDLDFYITNLGANVLYEKTGDGYVDHTFLHTVDNTFAAGSSLATSWGTFFFDVENDGDLDLFVANGFIPSAAFLPTFPKDSNKLYIWTEDQTFEDQTGEFNLGLTGVNRGCIYGDYDHDGDLDILITTIGVKDSENPNVFFQLLRNDNPSEHGYLKILLEGVTNNRDGFGSNVYVYLNDGRTLMRTLYSGGTHVSQNSKLLHFGLGITDAIDSLVVEWPNSVRDVFSQVPLNTNIFIQEGAGDYEILGCTDDQASNYNPTAQRKFACRYDQTTAIADVTDLANTIINMGTKIMIDRHSKGDQSYVIYNLLGQQMTKLTQMTSHDTQVEINITDFLPGMYLLLIFDGTKKQVFKFLKY